MFSCLLFKVRDKHSIGPGGGFLKIYKCIPNTKLARHINVAGVDSAKRRTVFKSLLISPFVGSSQRLWVTLSLGTTQIV